jgi:hypothetical protein
MNLSEYFEKSNGYGILATSNPSGEVNTAIYSRPHFLEEENILSFIMRDRGSYNNVSLNPHACYMFIEEGEGYKGIRIYMTKIREEEDQAKIAAISKRKTKDTGKNDEEKRFLVHFRVDKTRPLVGDNT